MPDELIVLGSSSAAPTSQRFPSAYALFVTGKLFLLDCGAPVSTLLYQHGLDPTDIHAIFLSHWHMDHIANLGLLLTQNHQYRRSEPLKVYGPRGTRGKIRRLLTDSFVMPEELSYELLLTNIKPGKTYKEALVGVTYFKTQHLDEPKLVTNFGRKAIACGMIINGPGWRIVYSGDIQSPEELRPYVKGCDLLIHEMAHAKPKAVAEFAASAKIPHVLTSHIGLEFDESPDKIVAAFAKRYQGNLIVAEDGTKVQLSQVRKKSTIEITSSTVKSGEDRPKGSSSENLVSAEQVDSKGSAFLGILQKEFNIPVHISYELLHIAQQVFVGNNTRAEPGQMCVSIANLNAPVGLPLTETDKVEVTLTVDAGNEDAEVKTREGATGLRRGRILRCLEAALEQGGILTQEDLANILNVDVRTIRRDIQALKSEGHTIVTRGQLKNDGQHQSYKVRIIELWLNRTDPDQVARWLHHSPQAIQRCINNFIRVVSLHQEDIPEDEIADLLQMPARLVQDYLEAYETALRQPGQRAKLKQELTQLEAR